MKLKMKLFSSSFSKNILLFSRKCRKNPFNVQACSCDSLGRHQNVFVNHCKNIPFDEKYDYVCIDRFVEQNCLYRSAMEMNDVKTEDLILKAAEEEFLEKGYSNAKMMSIARRAGVAHSMLHYYFRSKENLFQTIFAREMQFVIPAYEDLFEKKCSFIEVLRGIREARDRVLLSRSPRMPYFILTEILSNKKNRKIIWDVFRKNASRQMARFREMLNDEIRKGTVRPIDFMDFIMLLITIDAASLSAIFICKDTETLDEGLVNKLYETYKEHNIQLILEALKP